MEALIDTILFEIDMFFYPRSMTAWILDEAIIPASLIVVAWGVFWLFALLWKPEREIPLRRLKAEAERGNPDAQFKLGFSIEGDIKEAVRWFRKAAEQGHVEAQHCMGNAYEIGASVEVNHEKSFLWHLKAAEQGHVESQIFLVYAYEYGRGVEENLIEAYKWLEIAVASGKYVGNYVANTVKGRVSDRMTSVELIKARRLAKVFRHDARMRSLFSLRRLRGVSITILRLVTIVTFVAVLFGVGQFDPNTTLLAVLRKDAERGDIYAQYDLALAYEEGDGVPGDREEAFFWYDKASDQGREAARDRLLRAYEKIVMLGSHIYYDRALEKEAAQWLRKHAERGNARAQSSLGRAYRMGVGVPRDYEESVRWYRKAAEQGESSAQRVVGDAYAKGWGVEQNRVEAYKWFNISLALDDSSFLLDDTAGDKKHLAAEMTYKEIAEAERLTAEWLADFRRRNPDNPD